MTYVLIGLAMLAALTAAAILLLRANAGSRQPAVPLARAVSQGARAPAAVTAPRPEPAAMPAAAEPPPAELADFTWAAPDTLAADRQQALVAAVRGIPRPPAALHQMLSPQFLERASSTELGDLITGEAQIAAKVLASVNSPHYGLKQPVASIGQAVTFLGLNTVRSICLQYLLDDSFKPGNAELKRAYDRIWAASALASELCTRLAPRLGLAEPGALVAQVLLSFLGHLAAASLMQQQQPGKSSTGDDLLARARWAQDGLGLGAGEIGGLLLQSWGLPAAIVDEVSQIDRMLVTPVGSLPAKRGQRLAVAYLCARLGERLADGDGAAAFALASFDAATEPGADFFHLRAHLAPLQAPLAEGLRAADLKRAVQSLQQAMHGGR